ncbi:ATP-binding protein, partial [Staphylococcus hyicus]|uniref:ATP-binding protein n=1 Tax=Staphylococcus hyicus TaxID=1284 RepID=UPI0019DB1031
IAEEETGRIFERFYRVDKARSRESGGTGLGLSITQHIVVGYQGIIEVESEIGKGSTFRVQLPE